MALIGLGSIAEASQPRLEEALTNIMTLRRPGQDGLATVWDGNKYVQCRMMADRTIRCEAAGTLMQPSLKRVLSAERIAQLNAQGWKINSSFGNYVQDFPGSLTASQIADKVLQALREGYDADIANIEIKSDWVKSTPCPPRNGPGQNLAGMINDSPRMAAVAIHGCSYSPTHGQVPVRLATTAAELIGIYGPRMTGELQRLRINIEERIFVVFETGGGYVQCAPQTRPDAIYCEAQSAESWPVLSRILTTDRVERLSAAGFAEPGRAPNYWKVYSLEKFSSAAIANELLTILYDVNGYNGLPALQIATEKGKQ
jgi:hypothetical protein